MKWILRLLAGVVVVIVAAVIISLAYVDRVVKEAVETLGPEFTQTEVTLGGVSLSFLSGSAGLSDLAVANPNGFSDAKAFSLGEVQVDLDIGSILSDTILVERVLVRAPEITFEQTAKGSNLKALQRNIESAVGPGSSQPAETQSTEPGKKLIIRDLKVADGQIHYTNSLMAGKTTTVTLPEIHLTGIGEKSNGASASEVIQQLLSSINKEAIKAVANSGAVDELRDNVKERVEEEKGRLKDMIKGIGN
ncbi:hypothetical protein QP938_01590 [Porticoccaceae bacterium LTM1]|nr:hypothetical protein QP938_01590 [Porticoccaceae bacterium LTM1]